MTVDEVIRAHVLETLQRNKGNQSATARELGVDRSTLLRWLQRYRAEGWIEGPRV